RRRVTQLDIPVLSSLSSAFTKFIRGSVSGPTPSASAKSQEYNKLQGSDIAIYDGRFRANEPATTAPPVELYHPVFAKFISACASSTPIPDDHLRHTSALMRKLSVIATYEKRRDEETRNIFEDLLQVTLETVPNQDKISADFCHLTATPFNISAADLITEVKAELGAGGSDPSVQSSFSFTRFWVHDTVCTPCHRDIPALTTFQRKIVRDSCCCPSFLVGLAGPWVVILGAILTSRPIVQRLTPYLWFGCSRTLDDQQVLNLARPLYALKSALVDLQHYYASLESVPWTIGRVHSRFCPSITHYTAEDGSIVEFEYICPLERDPTCVTYRVDINKKPAVVKFVQQYGRHAHKFMAQKGLAPQLIYHGELGDGYGGLCMVVMELVEGKTLHAVYGTQDLPASVKHQVSDALNSLNDGGFVFGDLRRQNIMVAHADQSIRFIDFDWSGKDGEVRYPFHLSSLIRQNARAEEYNFITKVHQDALFKCL
ncbi:hypothetical protein B0H13DRAFT_2559789, partial [Mycena leptocephala]